MKKYYYKNKNSSKVYTNDSNVSDRNTTPITASYSGHFYVVGVDTDEYDGYMWETKTPWFCMKDGKYPIYSIPPSGECNDSTFLGFRKIFDFTVSSLSAQYYLYPREDTLRNHLYTTYAVPYTTPYLQTMDWFVGEENLFENVNINSAAKLQWKMKPELITQFRLNTQYGPNSYNSGDGFILKTSMRGSPAVCNNLVGFGKKYSNDNILSLFYMDITNITPKVIWPAKNNELIIQGQTDYPGTFNDNPPHFSLQKSKFPTETTGIRLKIDALFLHSTFDRSSTYTPDDNFINNTASFNNGNKSTDCLGLIYQTNEYSTWQWSYTHPNPNYDYLNGNYSATFDYIYNGEGNKLKNKSIVKTTNKTFCLNHWYEPERQDLTNPEFWNHIFVYNSNMNNSLYYIEHKQNPSNSGYMYFNNGTANYTGNFNLSAVDDQYNISTTSFLTASNKMKNLAGEVVDFSANDRFVIYGGVDTITKEPDKKYYNCYNDSYCSNLGNTYYTVNFSALTSINNSLTSYIIEARNGWKWDPIGNAPNKSDFTANNFNFSHCTMEYTIPIEDVSSDYLHISYPITTVICSPYGTQNKGLVLEYTLTYEFVK